MPTLRETYEAIARRAARDWGVPEELYVALINQESGFQTGLTSPAGARGIAQFMPDTAAGLGIDPDDPVAALYGGARYLRQQLGFFDGDLEKATAAYNAGAGGVQQAVARGGAQWRQFLPGETQSYLSLVYDRTEGGRTPMSPNGDDDGLGGFVRGGVDGGGDIDPIDRATQILNEIIVAIQAGNLTEAQAARLWKERTDEVDRQFEEHRRQIAAAAELRLQEARRQETALGVQQEATSREAIIARDILPRLLAGTSGLNLPLFGNLPLAPINLGDIRNPPGVPPLGSVGAIPVPVPGAPGTSPLGTSFDRFPAVPIPSPIGIYGGTPGQVPGQPVEGAYPGDIASLTGLFPFLSGIMRGLR